MLFSVPISPAAGPLYDQIIQAIRREIALGRLPPHTLIPSFRQLARENLVSVITVKRAYDELEQEGLIYRRQGLGTYIAESAQELCRSNALQQIEGDLIAAAQQASENGLGEKEWRQLTDRAWKKLALMAPAEDRK